MTHLDKQAARAKGIARTLIAKDALDDRRGIGSMDSWAVPLAEQYLAQAAELEKVTEALTVAAKYMPNYSSQNPESYSEPGLPADTALVRAALKKAE